MPAAKMLLETKRPMTVSPRPVLPARIVVDASEPPLVILLRNTSPSPSNPEIMMRDKQYATRVFLPVPSIFCQLSEMTFRKFFTLLVSSAVLVDV